MVYYSKAQRTRFLLVYRGETSLGFQVRSDRSGKFVITSMQKNSAASRAGLNVGDICTSYYADRTDDDEEDVEWSSDTIKQLERVAVPKIEANGGLRRRCVVIVVGHSKPDNRRTNFCNDNKRSLRFEKRLQAFESRNTKRRLDAGDAQRNKKPKLDRGSDEEEPEEEDQAQSEDSEEENVAEQTFLELSNCMNQYMGVPDPAAASVILDTLDFDPLVRMNLKALAKSLCGELSHLADDDGQDPNGDDSDMTNAVTNLEMLYKRVEESAALSEKTAEGLKPGQMTAEHVSSYSNLISNCNEAITATTAFLLKTPVSEAEQERRQKETQDRQHNQSRQLEEILTQSSNNVDKCSAAANRATTNTDEMMVSVREKTEEDSKELADKHDELKDLLRKYGSTRATKQHFLESEIRDIEAGIKALQRQRIQTMWTQQRMWDARSLGMLTPIVTSLLESCYREILDTLMKSGDDHPEWEEIRKSLEEVVFQNGGDDTDEEPIPV